jgi:hypothetical protein
MYSDFKNRAAEERGRAFGVWRADHNDIEIGKHAAAVRGYSSDVSAIT